MLVRRFTASCRRQPHRRALDNGELEGLKKNLAEKRTAEVAPVLADKGGGEAQNVLLALNRLGAKKKKQ